MVVSALAAEGMQSDVRFAESFVRSRIDKGAGPVRMRAELLARGLEDDVIENALKQYSDWWKDLALEVYQKRYGNDEPPEDFKERAKRANFMHGRGFTVEQVQHVLNPKK